MHFKFSLGKLSNRKSSQTWELVQIGGGGAQKNKKSPKFQWGKVKNWGGGLRKSKKSQVPEGTKDQGPKNIEFYQLLY